MSTKKQKAALAIQFPEVRDWLILHIEIYGRCQPLNIFNNSLPQIEDKLFGKEIFEWLNTEKHLFNFKGAFELISLMFERMK